MSPNITILALGLAAAFGLTWVAVSSLAPLARSLGLVDRPGGRKTHEQATPLIGGFAIAIGVGAPVLLSFQASPEIIGLCVASLII
ncbi:MAG TPA: hypothetical protein VEA79_02255, partial [Phenylobacterium sp.]|nr:hypothetical protein [Phenylobacterium sp.]